MSQTLVHQAQAQAVGLLPDDLITETQLAQELQVKPKTLANQRSRREGPPYLKLSGGIVRYSRKAVAEWLVQRTVSHGAA